MSYIGNTPYQAAFVVDQFSGNGSTTAFTMSVAPAGTTSVLVAVTGVLQDPSTYSVTGTTLTFSAAPPSGTGNISVRYLGIPASGVTTTAYRTVTEFTATAGQTTFTPPSYTVGYINVYRNGVLLGSADYTATNGTTVVLAKAATAGDLVVVESFYVSSVLNAISTSGGTIAGNLTINSASGQAPLVVQANGTYGLVTDSSGSVGIGTASPSKKFVVSNAGAAGVELDPFTRSATTGASLLAYNRSGSAFVRMDYDAEQHLFFTSGTERARFDSSGNLLVGTTSGNAGIQFKPNSGNCFTTIDHITGTASGEKYTWFFYNGSGIGSITQNGTTAVAYNTSSDYRLKENIQPMTGALAKVAQLKPVTYKWKSDGSDGEGFIAHELQEVVPQCVTGEKDAVDADGNPVYQGIDTSFLVATLTAAIQELKAKVEAQAAEIAQLKGQA